MVARREVEITLTPQQARFCDSPASYRALVGGRGAGKTYVGAYDLLRRAKGKGLYGVYAPTYRMLLDATLRTFTMQAERLGWLREWHRGDMKATVRDGAEVIFRSLDEPERARGANLSGAWIDEASLVPREAFEILVGALRGENGHMGWLSVTFTPKGRQHWTHEVFGADTADTLLVRAPTRANPFLPDEFYGLVRAQYTEQLAEQELEGRFIDFEGALANRAWFGLVEAAPAEADRARYWDFAATAPGKGRDPDWTVGTLMARADGHWYVEHVVRGRWGPGEVQRIVRQTAEADGYGVRVEMEQEPGSSGKLFVVDMIRSLAGWAARANPATGDKVTRVMPFLAQAEVGNVRLVNGPWVADWLDEICTMPNGAHDDQADSAAGAFAALQKPAARVRSFGPGGWR